MAQTSSNSEPTQPVSNIPTGSLLESIPDAVVIADVETGTVVEANDAAGTLFDCHPETLVGWDHSKLHPPENPTAYQAALRRAFEEGQVDRLEDGSPLYIETAAGERKPVEINARQLEADGRQFVLGVFRDISDRRRREQQLRETTTRLETLLDALPLPVTVLDEDGTVERWNQAAEETFGYQSETVCGEFYPLFVDYDEFDSLVEQLTEGDILDGYETTHRAEDGSVVDVELHARPLYEDDEVTGIIGAAIDVTEQKQRTQRLDVLHRVLRHNLRNRLAVIRGFANELVMDAGDEKKAATQIIDASDSLVDLAETAAETRKLVKRAQHGSDPIPLAEVVATVETSVGLSETTVTLTADQIDTKITVPRQSETIFTWLLEYVHEQTTSPDLEVSFQVEQRYVRLALSGAEQLLDDGARELIEAGRETSLRHGSGLDMAQVYLVLSAMGGTISTTGSEPPASTIQIELPRVDAD